MMVGLRLDCPPEAGGMGGFSQHPTEIKRPTSGPQSEGVTEHSDAVRDLIILQEIEFGNTISTFLSPAEYNKSKEDTYHPENLEDLYQDITKNVLRKIVKIRNLKNAIVKV